MEPKTKAMKVAVGQKANVVSSGKGVTYFKQNTPRRLMDNINAAEFSVQSTEPSCMTQTWKVSKQALTTLKMATQI